MNQSGFCPVCKIYFGKKQRFCSMKCADWAVENSPELLGVGGKALVGKCYVCGKRIFSAGGGRKYCSPDCHRIANKVKNNGRRESIPKYIREMIYLKYDGRCVYCGREANCIDHVLPVRCGGRTVEKNLVTACFQCNITASGNEFKNIGEKKQYILGKRGIEFYFYEKPEEIFIRPSWHARVYGGER